MAKQAGWQQIEYVGPFRDNPPRLGDSFYDPDLAKSVDVTVAWETLANGQIISQQVCPPKMVRSVILDTVNGEKVPSKMFRVYSKSAKFNAEKDIYQVQISTIPNSEAALREENAQLAAKLARLERDKIAHTQVRGRVEAQERLKDQESKEEAERLRPKRKKKTPDPPFAA
jgi:hypothetical protein